MGKSPKELLVATRYVREEHFAGGILACANHVAGFCDRVDLVTVLGARDSREPFVREHLKPNVRPRFFTRPDTGTVVKRRFVEQAFLNKMFEIAFLDDAELPAAVAAEVGAYLRGVLGQYDLVLVADYGHGFLNRDLIQLLTADSRFLAVNAQTNSANTGFNLVTKYPRADYVCIDEPEVRLAMHDRASPMESIIRQVTKDLTARRVAITRGHHGSMTYDELEEGLERAVSILLEQTRRGLKVMFIGNGASAAIGSHQALDYWKNGGMRAVTFNDLALLTAVSNDFSYAEVFEKPIEMFADVGDILLAISSSGRSENILRGADAARKQGCRVITFSGFRSDNPLRSRGELNFYVPSMSYGHVEVTHLALSHTLVDTIIDRRASGSA